MRDRWRCPVCRVIFYSPTALCGGGWPVYDPKLPAGTRRPIHPAVEVVPDTVDEADEAAEDGLLAAVAEFREAHDPGARYPLDEVFPDA